MNSTLYDVLVSNHCYTHGIGRVTNKDTLGKWMEQKLRQHSDLKENTDYAFSGLLYQLLTSVQHIHCSKQRMTLKIIAPTLSTVVALSSQGARALKIPNPHAAAHHTTKTQQRKIPLARHERNLFLTSPFSGL